MICHKTLKKEIRKAKGKRKGHTKKNFLWFLPCLLCVHGGSMGYLTGNFYLIPIFAIGFPFLYVSYSKPYQKNDRKKLQKSLTMITERYLDTDNMIQSVLDCITFLDQKTQCIFQQFLSDAQKMQLSEAVILLQKRAEAPFFKQWCKCVLLCQKDIQLKPILLSILKKEIDFQITMSSYLEQKQSIVRKLAVFLMLIAVFLLAGYIKYKYLFFLESVQCLTALYMLVLIVCIIGVTGDKEALYCSKNEENE